MDISSCHLKMLPHFPLDFLTFLGVSVYFRHNLNIHKLQKNFQVALGTFNEFAPGKVYKTIKKY